MTALRRPSYRHPAVLKHRDHGRLWRLVEGAVVDAFHSHPDFLTVAGHRSAVQSVTKRVVGQIVGHAKQAQQRGRLHLPESGSGGGAEISGPHQGAKRCLTLFRTRSLSISLTLCRGGHC